jgi:Uma2 family endonuclease
MSSVAASFRFHDDTPREDHLVRLRGLSWEDYERLLDLRGDKSAPRFTYLRGTLEIMSPSKQHEAIKSLIARLLESWCVDRGIEMMPYGSWTLKDREEERGAEPDECYIFGTEPRDRPHLAIEVEWTRGGMNKLDVYGRLGVDEVWIWRKGVIHVFVRQGDSYQEIARSPTLPDLDLALLASFLDRPTLTQALRAFHAAISAVDEKPARPA